MRNFFPTLHDRDDIETEIALAQPAVSLMRGDPHHSHTPDLILFSEADGLEGLAIFAVSAGFNLDEGDDVAAPGNNVYLAVAAAEVDLQDEVTMTFEVLAGGILAGLSESAAMIARGAPSSDFTGPAQTYPWSLRRMVLP